jgi:XTP/dITP diphosphohydrolase
MSLTPSDPSDLLISTRNSHKLREIHAIMADLNLNLIDLGQFPDAPEVEEDQDHLEGNAMKKAEVLFSFTELPTMADDTGLEVAALGGAPGVHSARFAGPMADSAANRALLLKRLHGVDDRRAQFKTVIAFATESGTRVFEGVCGGTITREEKGEGGFGYDSIFKPQGYEQTFAELAEEEKNRISHRGRALEKFKTHLLALTESFGEDPQ